MDPTLPLDTIPQKRNVQSASPICTGHVWLRYLSCSCSESCGEKAMGADNQQERLDAKWIVGFVDGEGCFHVAINKLPKMTLGWQVLPEFRVVQHQRDEQVLYKIKNYFGFGNVTINHGDRKEFRVRGLKNLKEIINFFKENPLNTSKQRNFQIFSKIVEMMDKGEHLTKEGLDKIAILSSTMNRQVKPMYLESSETLRRTKLPKKVFY